MSTSESKTELMKPLLIKAAIPTALSVAAYACAKIISKRSNPQENPLQSENEDQGGTTSQDDQNSNLEMQNEETEARVHQYKILKEREHMLTEMRNLMIQAQGLLKEISEIEKENQRIGEMAIEYTKVLDQLENLKMKNEFLQRKAMKHWRKAKQRMRVLRKQKRRIEARDEELQRNGEELEKRANFAQELEVEVAELKRVVDHLQREKIDLSNKLDLAEKLADSSNKKIKECVTKEEHERVLKELEQVQKDREEESKEIAYLKWSNACLRHEIIRYHEQAKDKKDDPEFQLEPVGNRDPRIDTEMCDCGCSASGNEDENCLAARLRVPSRRRRLVHKFKRWIEGGKNEDKDKDDCKSLPDEADKRFDHARKSCSSV